MRIEHIAIWTTKLEEMKDFYCKYFNGISNEKYINRKKGFESYFITFDEGARLEIMKRIDVVETLEAGKEIVGITHIAFKVGSKEEVNRLTETLRTDGYIIAGETRTSGDGYYESVILDLEGNRIELVA